MEAYVTTQVQDAILVNAKQDLLEWTVKQVSAVKKEHFSP